MPPLLERERELELLDLLVADVSQGSGRVVVLEAGAGMGKTSLLGVARGLAAGSGVCVLESRGSELEQSLAFGVVRQMLEPRIRSMDLKQRAVAFGGPSALAESVLVGGELATPGGRTTTPALLHAFFGLLAHLAEREPQMLVIDDAHWADQASLQLLAFLLARLEGIRLGALVATRPTDGTDALDQVLAAPGVSVLRPLPFSTDAVSALAERRLGVAADSEFVAACHEVTGGNPFFLDELLREVRLSGIGSSGQSVEQVRALGPRSVSQAVLGRIGGLGAGAVGFARALAVLGGGAALRHVAALAELGESEAVSAAESLIAAGVLEDAQPLRFSHPIVQAAIYNDLPDVRRAHGHRHAARVLLDEDAAPEQVAAHLTRSEPGREARSVRALRVAAQRLAARGAPETAVAYLRRALDEPATGPERVEVLRDLARLERERGVPGEAIAAAEEALRLAADPKDRVQVARELSLALVGMGRVDEATGVLDDVLVPAAGAEREVVLLTEAELVATAALGFMRFDIARARLLAHTEALTGATPGERLLLALSAVARFASREPFRDGVEVAEQALGGGRLLSDVGPESVPYYQVVYGLAVADAYETAHRALTAAIEHARALGLSYGFITASTFRSYVAYRTGDLAGAEADARSALDAMRLVGSVKSLPGATAYLIEALLERGAIEEANAALSELEVPDEVPWMFGHHQVLFARGKLKLACGDPAGALADFREQIHRARSLGIDNPAGMPSWSAASTAHLALGEQQEARLLAGEELEMVREFGAPRGIGVALRALGVAEGGGPGVDHLRGAVAVLEDSPARLEHARALVDLGASLRRANKRSEARQHLRQGLRIAQRCGAKLVADHARQELAATGARPRRELVTGVASLTASERRVAEMAAEGLSNLDIAQALFITRKTVEKHLGNAYMKLDIGGRDQLLRALTDAGAGAAKEKK